MNRAQRRAAQRNSNASNATAAAMNGVLDEKKGRMVSNLADRIIEAHQAESRSRLVSLQLKESVVPMGEAKL